MTREWFRGLRRGDLLTVDGNGHAVVDGVFLEDGLVRVDLRLQRGEELMRGIPESECEVIRPILEKPPMTTLGDLLAEKRRSRN